MSQKKQGDQKDEVVQLATRISKRMHRALQYLSLDRETPIQDLVTEAVEALLAKHPRRTLPLA